MFMTSHSPTAVVAEVGPGLGRSISRRFANQGGNAGGRGGNAERIRAGDRERLAAFGCDLTMPDEVSRTFAAVEAWFGPPHCAVFNAGPQPGIDPRHRSR